MCNVCNVIIITFFLQSINFQPGLFFKRLVGYDKSVHFEMHNMDLINNQQQQQSNDRQHSFDI